MKRAAAGLRAGSAIVLLATLLLPPPPTARANRGLVVRDGSLGAGGPGVVPPGIDPEGRAADYLIGPELGEQRGRSLFHSFERFGIGTGETATFTGPDPIAGPQTVENVVSRVTGGSVSELDGALRSTIPGADVYLLNPAGVLFGAEAQLDVPGSFHASTAESLEFTGGGLFEARLGGALPILETAEPAAFGFLGGATIELRGSTLEVPSGIDLAAGNVTLGGGAGIAASAFGEEAGGDVSITAASRLVLEGTGPGGLGVEINASTFGSGPAGSIRLEGGIVDLRDGAGILSRSGDELLGGQLGPGGDISIVAHERLSLSGADRGGQPSSLSVSTFSAGDAGTIRVEAPVVELRDRASIATNTFGSGGGGAVRIDAGEAVLLLGSTEGGPGASISSSTTASGHGGSVAIAAPTVELTSRSLVVASTLGTGNAGSIEIDAATVVLAEGSSLAATSTASSEGGSSGGITLGLEGGRYETERVELVGASSLDGDSSARAGAESRGITLRAREVHVLEGSRVSTATQGPAAGGDIRILAGEEVRVAGSHPTTGVGSSIVATARSSGPAGSVHVEAPRVELEGAQLVTATTVGGGRGGDISIVGRERVTLAGVDGGGFGTAVEASTFGAGDAGTIRIESGVIELLDGAVLLTQSLVGTGGSGAIDLVATDRLTLEGVDGRGRRAGLSVSALFVDAGSIEVTAGRFELRDGALVATNSFGGGSGGDIVIDADRVLLSGSPGEELGASILAGSNSSGTGGSVAVRARDVELRNRSLISGSNLGEGDGGDVVIEARGVLSATDSFIGTGFDAFTDLEGGFPRLGDAGDIRLHGEAVVLESSLVVAQAEGGAGGDISLAADAFIASTDSVVDASSDLGIDGRVVIDSPDVDVVGDLATLPVTFLDAAALLREACGARGNGAAGSFVVQLRAGLPADPDGLLPASVGGSAPRTIEGGFIAPFSRPARAGTALPCPGGRDWAGPAPFAAPRPSRSAPRDGG